MDFNGPGTSLFQGSDLNAFSINAQREEEEEAIEEQRRRDIELKSILENAFNDVSFDNEEFSGINISFNQSNSNSNNQSLDTSPQGPISNSNVSIPEVAIKSSKLQNQEFDTPVRHTRSIRTKPVAYNSHFITDNLSDQFRTKQQNGSLQDIVDASGGGGDAGMSLHYNHCIRSKSSDNNSFQNSVTPNADENISVNKHYQSADFNSLEELRILYDVRVREVHRLTELIDKKANEYEIEKSELQKQLGIAAAEIERCKLSQNDLQSRLVESKEEVHNLRQETENLKKTINNLQESRENLLIELDTSRATMKDLERKLLAIEKGWKDTNSKMQYEANIQELKEKHAQTLKIITDELDKCKANLDTTLKENNELKHKIIQISQINDENLTKKSEIITRLSKQIEETQEHCEKLMKSSFSEDNIKLQLEIKILKEENGALMSKIDTLEKNLANYEMELKQYESINSFCSFGAKEASEISSEQEGDYSDMNRKLREELFRALNCQKARRQEIQTLQSLILKKDEQIRNIVEKQSEYMVEIEKLKENIGKLMVEVSEKDEIKAKKEAENLELKQLLETSRIELEKALENSQKTCKELGEKNKALEDELTNIKNNSEKEKLETVSKYNEEYMKFHNDGLQRVREEVEESLRLELLGKDIEIETLKKELEEVKNLYVEVYNEKETLLNQIDREKANSSRSSVDVDEVRKLQMELEKSRQRILELDLTLRQQYQKEVETLNEIIRNLSLDLEKVRREKDHDGNEKKKLMTENELLKRELEESTAEKNLYLLSCQTLRKDVDELRTNLDILREATDIRETKCVEKQNPEIQEMRNKYEIKNQKPNKEIDLMVSSSVGGDLKYPSSMMSSVRNQRHIAIQGSPVIVHSVSTSPLHWSASQESCTSPIHELKRDVQISPFRRSNRDVSILTDPEPKALSKRDVIRLMEKLGKEHEAEMVLSENKYKLELMKTEKKWQAEIDSIRDKIKSELTKIHAVELEELRRKHNVELENRVEQEKKEAVVGLITEWAYEVQTLKEAHAEAVALANKMKLKYQNAQSTAARYKTYFTVKAEKMKLEWKKAEENYENALKELEKNVHMLVNVREDEVKAKVESIAKIYEHKIRKMKKKLEKYEDQLRNDYKVHGSDAANSSKSSTENEKISSFSNNEPDKLVVPNSHLCRKGKSECTTKRKGEVLLQSKAKHDHFNKLILDEPQTNSRCLMGERRTGNPK